MACYEYNPDNIFKRFKVVEFPISFVNLSTVQNLDVEVDLNTSAYLKTTHDGLLWKFEEAREKSASHRAFDIVQVDNRTIQITFKPKSECISKAKRSKNADNRFVFDLRVIKIDGIRCCNNELHSEIGRYYISGQYEYSKITHRPKKVDFGDVYMNASVTKYVRLRNESRFIAAKVSYIRVTGFEVTPPNFIIHPNSSKQLRVTIKPTCLKVDNTLAFNIRNPHDLFDARSYAETSSTETNHLTYLMSCQVNVIYSKVHKEIQVESLHKLQEQDPRYTYIGDEVELHKRRKKAAFNHLQICKSSYPKKPIFERFSTGKEKCCSIQSLKPKILPQDFCKSIQQKIDTYSLSNILFLPFSLNFGRVGLMTFGELDLTIINKTKYDVTIKLYEDACCLYTLDKLTSYILRMKSKTDFKLKIFCWGFVEGNYKGTFEYTIDNKYRRKHPYTLQVGNPTLMVQEKNLKFGMVTTESFVTSVPIRIYNYFNISVDFKWEELCPDVPFDILPISGSIPSHTCKICDVIYVCKPSKTKTHEVNFVSHSKTIKVVPIELNIMTRKLSIKFLQSTVMFKDIALNLETKERAKLENSSREIAIFHVVEPLIPGLRIEPMSGTIRPKMIITFEIIIKIPCVLEFAFDVFVKINNKENVILPISGNVVEPKILIHPKNIYMSRVPCHMITYVPVTFQNLSTLKSEIEVLQTGDENIFDVYVAVGNEKQRVFKFSIDGGQTKTVFVKVCDIFRREYEMYIPFKVNGLLGPPDHDTCSTELQYYIGQYEQSYENNPKVKLKTVNKDISYCKMMGVITVPWIHLSVDKFEIEYTPLGNNSIEFTMTNVSKYYLYISILTNKLFPNFTLDLRTEYNQSIINENYIKFELDRRSAATFTIKFHPKGHGRFISTAMLFLDKNMTTPYYNLTFLGKRQTPAMIPSLYRLIFPPSYVGTEIIRMITLKIEVESNIDSFTCSSKEETNLIAKFIDCKVQLENEELLTIVTVAIKVCCQITYARNITLCFNHECGSCCEVEVSFCFTYCALTLHTDKVVTAEENPYPYYPLSTQSEFYHYMEQCSKFLEKWMFQQGFRRDLYPVIPDTFHAISSVISSPTGSTKTKGINVGYLNFLRRIAGPLMKHIRKISVHGVDESFKCVKEIHDTYREIINLLRSRGADLWVLQAKFLLSYDQFVIYADNVTPKCNANIILTQELLADVNLFNRLTKQSWIDFILQSYKVFVMDSCFFECVCVSSQPRDIIKVLIEWYNEQILVQHKKLFNKSKLVKSIDNITTGLSSGIAIASAILTYCPYMQKHYAIFCEVDEAGPECGIINNACLNIEAFNILRLYFPLNSKDFLEPNFMQMLFLSVHLYVALPMFKPKDTVKFTPPLLRSSTRQLSISPTSQESLIFTYIILNNNRNNFFVEKAPAGDNGKKMFLSVKYTANFTDEDSCILLIHGYNKTRIFDTYIVFLLKGHIGSLNPLRKCRVTGPLYRPNKVDVLVSSPFAISATFSVYLTDNEPSIPVDFNAEIDKPKFYIRRLNLIDKEIMLSGIPKESGQEVQEHKLYLQMICLSTQVGNSWIWFRSELGEFFVRVTSQPRWDLAIDTLQATVQSWPMDPCSCGEACECYRTTVLMIPHRNELMLKAMRYSLLEHASDAMMDIFDDLIETTTGKIILGMLLLEGGSNMTDVHHILRSETTYRITSRVLLPRLDRVTLAQHTGAVLPLPVTVPVDDKSEKYSVTFTSECGMDIRTYRIFFIECKEQNACNE
ncbi:hypothetical protein K1T71_002613 [Dendrolimus kikuchii]|uniref:Uncharacterized protein n=1 Tax=Dendrolimus kikuchii TaxID=765133 RepID=A0ACC1DE50_9NEOP|nr:hypothetical protein K1T71_002613 [Dendrolimus kikuchii]